MTGGNIFLNLLTSTLLNYIKMKFIINVLKEFATTIILEILNKVSKAKL